MAEYQVSVDTRFSGTMYIEANSAKEAEQIARSKSLVPSDIKNFYHSKTTVVEVEEVQ